MRKTGIMLAALASCAVAVPAMAGAYSSAQEAMTQGPDHVTILNDRIDILEKYIADAVSSRRLTKSRASKLRMQLGRIRTESAHQQSVNGAITPGERASFDTRLNGIERSIPGN